MSCPVVELPGGSFVHPEGLVDADQLGSGRLEPGASVEGDVYFDIKSDDTNISIAFESGSDASERAVWPATISR